MKSLLSFVITIVVAGYLSVIAANQLHNLLNQNQLYTQTVGSNASSLSGSGIWRSLSSAIGSATTPTTSSPTPSVSTAASNSNSSINWAGYQSSGGTYTSVSGSWRVPSVTSSDSTAADAAWIGIGGVSTQDLIQTGTQDIVSPDGQDQVTAFYELLPDNSVQITNLNISPGDKISASINEVSSGDWNITLTDDNNGQSQTINTYYDSSLSSAEWIEEDPSDGVSQIPLDNFSVVNFSDAYTTDNGTKQSIAASNGQAITMINQADETLASTSALGSDGTSFSVSRTDASTVASISEFNYSPSRWVRRGITISFRY